MENTLLKITDSEWPALLDAMSAATDHHEILFENDRVRVLDSRLASGDQTPLHTHRWPGVLYIIGTSDFVRYDSEGNVIFDSRKSDRNIESGTAVWAEPLAPHFVKNVGVGELRVIAIEIKD